MITISYSDELKENKKKREDLEKQINNTQLTTKIENFVKSSTQSEINSGKQKLYFLYFNVQQFDSWILI